MGFPALPALFMIIGGVKFLPETPNSLVERGSGEKGREVLKKIRGIEDVDAEFQDIKEASEFANGRTGPHFCAVKNIFQRRNRPQLTMVVLMPIFQNLTGIVFVFTYAPLLFLSMGYRRNANLYSAATNGSVLVVSSLVSMATVDRLGRKAQLISGGIIMFICQVEFSFQYLIKINTRKTCHMTIYTNLNINIFLSSSQPGYNCHNVGIKFVQ